MNSLAEQGFARGAEAYARARPSYPPGAVERLYVELGLTAASAVLDLGAGTGKLTALLTGLGRVVAVEPVAEMRAELSKLALRAVAKSPVVGAEGPEAERKGAPATGATGSERRFCDSLIVEAREGKAEAIPLADSEVDAVVCGQAFHWFSTPQVLAEIHRVLKPRGGLALLWNRWDRRVAWADRVKAVTAPYDALRPQYESYVWKKAFESQSFFGPLHSAEFPNGYPSSREDVCVRMASTSSIAVLPEADREEVLARVRAVLDSEPATAGWTELTVPYLTEVFWTRRVG